MAVDRRVIVGKLKVKWPILCERSGLRGDTYWYQNTSIMIFYLAFPTSTSLGNAPVYDLRKDISHFTTVEDIMAEMIQNYPEIALA